MTINRNSPPFFNNDSVRVVTSQESDVLVGSFVERGYHIASVDGAETRSEAALFSRLAQELKFPDYFGNNWDALDECLRDLEWLPAKGYVLRFANADDFAKAFPAGFRTLLQIIASASHSWKADGIDFILIAETPDPTGFRKDAL